MNIKDLKDLKKLIATCRSLGVDAIEIDGIKMSIQLNYAPLKSNRTVAKAAKTTQNQSLAPGGITEDTSIQMPDELTQDQMLFWSANAEDQAQ